MTVTIAEHYRREGEARGRAEGKAEGKAEAVTSVLRSRFGAAPATVLKKVMGLTDVSRIDEMLRLAATCGSLKEFQKPL